MAAGLRVVTKREPTADEWIALRFAWRVCAHVKSNTVLFTSANRTLAIGAGQMSRVDSARIASIKAEAADKLWQQMQDADVRVSLRAGQDYEKLEAIFAGASPDLATLRAQIDGLLDEMIAACAPPAVRPSAMWSTVPAPPLATTGTPTDSLTRRVIMRSKPALVPSASMELSTISPAPRATARLAHSTASKPVACRPPLAKASQRSGATRLQSIETTMH